MHAYSLVVNSLNQTEFVCALLQIPAEPVYSAWCVTDLQHWLMAHVLPPNSWSHTPVPMNWSFVRVSLEK